MIETDEEIHQFAEDANTYARALLDNLYKQIEKNDLPNEFIFMCLCFALRMLIYESEGLASFDEGVETVERFIRLPTSDGMTQ